MRQRQELFDVYSENDQVVLEEYEITNEVGQIFRRSISGTFHIFFYFPQSINHEIIHFRKF